MQKVQFVLNLYGLGSIIEVCFLKLVCREISIRSLRDQLFKQMVLIWVIFEISSR